MSFFDAQISLFLKELEQAKLPRPWLILLEGNLGAGKTTWTQEFVAALGGDGEGVKSPTFLKLISHEIPGFGSLLHMDAYRIEDCEEFLRLGLESYENVGAIVIEWPEVFLDFLKTYPEYKSLLGINKYAELKFSIDEFSSARVIKKQISNLS